MAWPAIGALWRGRPARLKCQHRPSPDPSSRRLLMPSSQGQRGWSLAGCHALASQPYARATSGHRRDQRCSLPVTQVQTQRQQTPLPAGPRTSSTCAALPLSHPFHNSDGDRDRAPTETGEGPWQTALRPGSDAVALSASLIHHQSTHRVREAFAALQLSVTSSCQRPAKAARCLASLGSRSALLLPCSNHREAPQLINDRMQLCLDGCLDGLAVVACIET